jgi:tetratricopeptide (TPR) repeat protein
VGGNRFLQALTLALTGLIFMTPSGIFGAMTEEETQDLFSQAKRIFRQANEMASSDSKAAKELYQKAVMRFERLARDGGIRNGKLYYNIGNTYFRLGNLGKAILNYRRAERYLPDDPNLHQNLQYARSRRQDKIEEEEQTKVLKVLFFWHYDFSPWMRSTIFIFSYVGFWIGLSVRLFSRKAMPRWILTSLGLVAVLFIGSLLYGSAIEEQKNSYEPAFKESLHAGTEFILVEDRGDWHQITLKDGRRCWIPRKVAEFLW